MDAHGCAVAANSWKARGLLSVAAEIAPTMPKRTPAPKPGATEITNESIELCPENAGFVAYR